MNDVPSRRVSVQLDSATPTISNEPVYICQRMDDASAYGFDTPNARNQQGGINRSHSGDRIRYQRVGSVDGGPHACGR